jgi:HPt (histidine-containing phosphotransfer) domain-containing protein
MGCCGSNGKGVKEPENTSTAGSGTAAADQQFQLQVKDPPNSKPVQAPGNAKPTTANGSQPPDSGSPQPTKEEPAVNKDLPQEEITRIRNFLAEEMNLKEQPIIDEAQALDQSSGDKEFLKEIMGAFRKEYPNNQAKITQGWKSRDWELMTLESHSLKGAAANIFIMRMKAICFFLEQSGKTFQRQLEQGESIGQEALDRVQVCLDMLEESFREFQNSKEFEKIMSDAE